jgi:hypothetical protein
VEYSLNEIFHQKACMLIAQIVCTMHKKISIARDKAKLLPQLSSAEEAPTFACSDQKTLSN